MDIQLNVMEAGEGFPLVLLHGNGEDSSYFKHQMEPFSKVYHVYAVETRGHGQSPRGTAPFTLDQFAEDLKEFLDQRGISRCHILGFSDGGNIAILFALKYPEYVEKLILNGANLDPSGVKREDQEPFEKRWAELKAMAKRTPEEDHEFELLDLMVTQPHIDPKALAALTMPVLVVAGDQDLIEDDHTRAIAKAIPGSTLLILPGDHFVARHYWRSFNPYILAFLSLP